MSNSVPVIRCTEARHSILEYAHFNVICVRCLRYDQVNLNSHNGNNYGSSYLHTAHMQLDPPSDTQEIQTNTKAIVAKTLSSFVFLVRLTFIANKFEYSVFKFSRFSRCWMPRGAIRPILEQVAWQDVVFNYILEGHVFQRVTVLSATQCHVRCKDNCLCVSMNYFPQSKENNCELNDANREMVPAAIKWRPGGNYHDLVRSYTVKVSYDISLW